MRQQRTRSTGQSTRNQPQMTARQRRLARMNRPPTWRAAFNRAGIAAAVFLTVLVLVLKQSAADSLALAGFMLLVYIPMGYAMDSFIFRLRQRRKASETER